MSSDFGRSIQYSTTIVVLLLASTIANGEILFDIDTFASGFENLAATAVSTVTTSTQHNLSGVLGGSRTSTAVHEYGPFSARAQVNTGIGALSVDVATKGKAVFSYGSQADGGTSLNKTFLRQSDGFVGQGIYIEIEQNNLGSPNGIPGPSSGIPNQITVELYTDGGGSSTATLVLDDTSMNKGYYLSFSDFSQGALFSDIDGIRVTLGSSAGGTSPDIGVNQISVYGVHMPEPASVVMFATVLGASGFFYRRRKNVQVTA